ncbi:hypothetical protein ACWC10_17465 [Streptomyces sp. NPDC001595]|uniref:hypothetical protein n=1 Tax=Streptomyces sp. NPDC001532 TaxID=3154520 RepID=UPI003322FAA7
MAGPTFRDVLPALTGTVLTLSSVVAALAVGYRAAGVGVPLAAIAVLVLAVPLVIRRLRPGARRRKGHYTARELFALDTQELALAVARMLRRDGWRVRLLAEPERPRLYARRADGRELHVVFRPVAEPLPDEAPPPPRARRTEPDRLVHLVVHRGTFRARDIRWARRQGDTCLLDGTALVRWASGTPFDELRQEER